MSWILDKLRGGGVVTREDKIASVRCADELDAMVAEWGARGVELSEAERHAVARRRVEIMKGVV